MPSAESSKLTSSFLGTRQRAKNVKLLLLTVNIFLPNAHGRKPKAHN